MTLSRRTLLASLAGGLLTSLGLGGYALAVEPGFRMRVTPYALTPPGWTPSLKLKVAVLTDLHAGLPHMPLARIERIVEATNALEPDLVVLLGDYAGTDFISSNPPLWAEVVPLFKALSVPLGTWAILGNHEFWDDPAAQRVRRGPTLAHRAFADAGLPLLENDAVRLVHGGLPFWLLGLGDQLAYPKGRGRYDGVDDLSGTLAKLTDDAPAILLAHEPDIFPEVPDRVSLTLSGHTHGGQVRILGWSPKVPSIYGNRYAYGHVIERGRNLIVSGGLGTVSAGLAPVRLGVPPEIVLITLGGAPGATS